MYFIYFCVTKQMAQKTPKILSKGFVLKREKKKKKKTLTNNLKTQNTQNWFHLCHIKNTFFFLKKKKSSI